MKLLLLLIAALPALAQSEIKCDGYDIQKGVIRYACAWVNYPQLVALGLPWTPDINGRPVYAIQIWVRTYRDDVDSFAVTITFDSDYDGEVSQTMRVNRNPNPAQQSIAEFRIGLRRIKSVKIKELRVISEVDW